MGNDFAVQLLIPPTIHKARRYYTNIIMVDGV